MELTRELYDSINNGVECLGNIIYIKQNDGVLHILRYVVSNHGYSDSMKADTYYATLSPTEGGLCAKQVRIYVNRVYNKDTDFKSEMIKLLQSFIETNEMEYVSQNYVLTTFITD